MIDGNNRFRAFACLTIALALLTSGCVGLTSSSGSEPASQGQTIDMNRRSGNTSQPSDDQASTNSTARETTNTSDDGSAPADRTVKHALGRTTLRGEVDRVVALEYNLVESALALGIQPVGVANPQGYEKWVDAGNLSKDVTDVGTRAEPSLEKIANLNPDLILGIEFRHKKIYEDLSNIAPTLVFEGFPDEEDRDDQYDRMLSIYERVGKATARQEQTQQTLDAIEQSYQDASQRIQAHDAAGREVLLSQLFTYEGQPLARVFLNGSIPANVAEKIGLANAWTKTGCSTGYGYCDVGKEGFADVQHADFFYQAQPNDNPVQDEWKDDPVWNSYDFVQEDRVYNLGPDAWMFGGPIVVQRIADRIADHYAK